LEKDKSRLGNALAERLFQLENTPAPKGAVLCEDIDIDVFEYEAHIVGLAQSYLAGLTIDRALVLPGDSLSHKLDECEDKLRELRAYKNLVSEVASLLLESL
jgi:hypothetical protein